ncbi:MULTISPECIES: hypothetical protein [unclassified Mesorhizobium]|uniref:hypothetical protein n=1 Tax=unclassified Mesorhizobium TaxID=325217 RepID=UPI000FCAB1BC|nr:MULTISPECIES: hypothetical protein [unclassified Mesorhizobium]RUW78634.1 hypothetical protein EOA31_01115 [Mesorhizobium sp. M4B.F.Ca.ET.049.02.1.2]TGV22847.1 hypothetical protein EN786_27445 [Mesorhizobium sp. M4B.F.Ca.ET.143.01.1.1]
MDDRIERGDIFQRGYFERISGLCWRAYLTVRPYWRVAHYEGVAILPEQEERSINGSLVHR